MTHDPQPTAEYDAPYAFRSRPQAIAPFPFREIEYARLLILRGRIQDGSFGRDDGLSPPRWRQ
jgi:hypothetical protein